MQCLFLKSSFSSANFGIFSNIKHFCSIPSSSSQSIRPLNTSNLTNWTKMMVFLSIYMCVYSKTLKICTKPASPFANRQANTSWTGFSIDYWNKDIMPVVRERTDYTDSLFIDCVDNVHSLRQVSLGHVDVAHAAITKTANREEIVDFSTTWFVSGFRVLVRQNNDFFSSLGNILRTLGSAIGLFIAVLIILTIGGALILSIAEMVMPGPIDPWDTSSWLSNFMGASTVIQNTLLPGSGSIIEPYGTLSRIVLSGFKSFGAMLPPILTALITMILVINNSSGTINSVDDLPGKTVIVPRASTALTYLSFYGRDIKQIQVDSVEEMLNRFANGEGDAVIYDWPILQNFVNTQKSVSTVGYQLVGDVFEEQQYGIAISQNNTILRAAINRAVLLSWETPEFKTLESKWFKTSPPSINQQVDNANNQLIALLILGSFILGLGIVITAVFLIIRCFYHQPSKTTVQTKSIDSLGNNIKTVIERQEKYAAKLPPNTLTYANWELLAAISNFLKEWRPASV
ncbi:putative ABC-type amino acid transporter [Cafeteria roenbergensis virus]|uniref:Putative ABC-type amino acid transporter n=1 Tax=Cafeteria roenbergensis virus (strain BV-PW1) TaxID=693272 RepID=E3T502_CROVB|nr:putative ABC-type amino acid transporter [Cafeteria roenbergensis virus BV-PW1]ADO67265.1 putative ABC-type amino acid transporter [Cafeteria roenbergensis virus BV-PW1]